MNHPAGTITVAALARRHGIGRRAAHLWMIELEEKHGPAVVRRVGVRGVLVADAAALSQVIPLCPDTAEDDARFAAVERRLEAAQRRQAETDRAIATMAGAVARGTSPRASAR